MNRQQQKLTDTQTTTKTHRYGGQIGDYQRGTEWECGQRG